MNMVYTTSPPAEMKSYGGPDEVLELSSFAVA